MYIPIADIEESLYQLVLAPDEVNEDTEVKSEEELVSIWKSAKDIEDTTQWTLGDIAQEAIRAARKNDPNLTEKSILEAFALATGDEYSTMRTYAWVSKVYANKAIRKTGLSWSHYRTAAKTDEPLVWLELAVDQHLTTRALEHLIKEAGGATLIESLCCSKCNAPLPEHGVIVVYRDGKREAAFDKDACALTYFSDLLAMKAEIFGTFNNTDTADLHAAAV